MHRFGLTAVAVALTLVACDDITDPGSDVVEIEASVREVRIEGLDGESPRIVCNVELEIAARERIRWSESVLYVRFGPQDQVVDTVAYSPAETAQLLGGADVGAGQQRVANVSLQAGMPFRLEGAFHYTSSEGLGEASVEVPCGPVEGEGAAPEIVSFEISNGVFEPGDTIEVQSSIRGGAPLWQSVLIVSGAVDDTIPFPEYLRTSATRLFHYRIPPHARLGEPLQMRLALIDVAWRQAESATMGTSPLVDNTTPSVTVHLCPTQPVRCQFAVGDPLPLTVHGSDNGTLGWLYYQVGVSPATYDSAALWHGGDPYIPVRQEWLGETRVRAWVSDRAGNTDTDDDLRDVAVHFFPVSDAATTVDTLEGSPLAAAVDPAFTTLYLVTSGQAALYVLPLGGVTVTRIPLPDQPAGVDVLPDGKTVVIALTAQRAVALIDPSNGGSSLTIVPVPALYQLPGMNVEGVTVASDGKWLLVANPKRGIDSSGRVVVHDPATGTGFIVDGTGSGMISAHRSGNQEFVAVQSNGKALIYDASVGAFGSPVSSPGPGLASSYSGEWWTNGPRLMDGSLTTITAVPGRGDWLEATAPAWEGETVLQSRKLGVERVDAFTGQVRMRLGTPELQSPWIFAGPSGSEIAVIGESRPVVGRTVVVRAVDSPLGD